MRSALTPQSTKHEAAFFFDEHRCDNTFVPGVECADALFKALDPKTTHSILGGELVDDRDEIARTLLRRSAVVAKDLDFKHPCFCYALYVNNLSEGNVSAIDPAHRVHSCIADDKFEKYLKTAKLGKLKKAGVADLTKAELEAAIREKLRMSYLYNMEWVDKPTHQLSKFNIMLEFQRQGGHPERMVVALEYRHAERALRLLTVS